jgi:hypothetical protein
MRISTLFLLILIAVPAFAKDKPAANYQDGVLQSVHTISTGSSCSGHAETDGTVTGNTLNATTNSSAHCSDNMRWVYTVRVADGIYDLTPDHSGGAYTAAAISPVGLLFIKHSSLYGRMPGTLVKVRSGDKGVFVLVNKRETRYTMMAAH